MNTFAIILWIAIMVAMIVLEAATVSLVSVWFAGGALCALIATLCGAGTVLQIVLFAAVSGILLACLRPLSKKLRKQERVRTNADRVLDMAAVVTETIDNLQGTGAVKADGKLWTARSEDGSVIPEGTIVRVLRLEGVKLFVAPAEIAAAK